MITISRLPTLAQLRAFVAVAEYLHFRDAAASVPMSQAALSAAVAGLEETLGTQLVERTTRRVLLTPAGERVVHHARAVLEAVDALVDESAEARKPFTGPLRLGVIPTIAPYLLPELLGPFTEAFPKFHLEVREQRTAELLKWLGSGQIDLAVLALPIDARGVQTLPLYDEDLCLVVPEAHPLAGQERVSRRMLRDSPMLLLDRGNCLREHALELCRAAGAREVQSTRAATLSTLVRLVAGGLGITVIPRTSVATEAPTGSGLRVLPFAGERLSRRIALAFRSSTAREAEFAEVRQVVARLVRDRGLPVNLLEPDGRYALDR